MFLIGPTPEGGAKASVFMASVDQVVPVGVPPTVDATLVDLVDNYVQARRADADGKRPFFHAVDAGQLEATGYDQPTGTVFWSTVPAGQTTSPW